MKGSQTYHQRQEAAEKPKTQVMLLRIVVVAAIAVVAYLAAGLAIDQFDLLQLLRSNPLEISAINLSTADLPKWGLQLVLAVGIFFVLQPLLVILLDIAQPENREGSDMWRG
jgi:hypothetical protein